MLKTAKYLTRQAGWLGACVFSASALAAPITVLHAQQAPVHVAVEEDADNEAVREERDIILHHEGQPLREERRLLRRELGRSPEHRAPEHREYAWLGLSTEEAPETLATHLKLGPGVGLVVTYLAPDGPAAKAGLQKNDVLIDYNGQPLVLPEQLRKLVRVGKVGEEVKLGYLRQGERQTVELTLGKTSGMGALGEQGFRAFGEPFREMPLFGFREQMNGLRESLGNLKFDQERVQEEVKRSLNEAKRAVEEALRQAGQSKQAEVHARALKELARSQARAGHQPGSVVVRSHANEVRSVVRSDDSGTMVIISNPKPRLTVHDKEGKLVFDGPISTTEERERVPKEVWERAEPMLDEMGGLPEALEEEK